MGKKQKNTNFQLSNEKVQGPERAQRLTVLVKAWICMITPKIPALQEQLRAKSRK